MLFNQIRDLYILPELQKRHDSKILSDDFRVRQCLIKLPQNKEPIVLLNDEVKWLLMVTSSEAVNAGDTPYLHQLTEFYSVQLPEEDGKRIAFIFFKHRVNNKYDIIFDATPNSLMSLEEREETEKQVHDLVLEFLKSGIADFAAQTFFRDDLQKILYENGLWLIPRLLPYPLSQAIHIIETSPETAIQVILDYCNQKNLLRQMLNDWWSVELFNSRQKLIEDCCFAHENNRYSLSIHTLMPQVEGIITDWIYTQISKSEVPFRTESKTLKFMDTILEKDLFSLSYPIVVESVMSFINKGPVLKTFKDWFETIDDVFPNRHALLHGKYENSLYTEINSLRLFLLLDSVFFLIKAKDDQFLNGSKYALAFQLEDEDQLLT
jgi:hypothetical protein